MPSPHSLFQTTLPNGLIYRIEQYLPPPGPYYDQGSLIAVFGMAIFRSKSCTICWTRHPSGGFSSKSCGKQCKICGTRRHPDEVSYVPGMQEQCSADLLVSIVDTDSGTRVVHCSTVTEIGIASTRSNCSRRLFRIGKFGPTNTSSAFYVALVFCLNKVVAVRFMQINNIRLYRPSTKIRQSQGQCRGRFLRRIWHTVRRAIRRELDPCPWRTPLLNKHFRRPCAHTPCRKRL
jgi:hypothetical protein